MLAYFKGIIIDFVLISGGELTSPLTLESGLEVTDETYFKHMIHRLSILVVSDDS